MNKRVLVLALGCIMSAQPWAGECEYIPPRAVRYTPMAIHSQRLVLAGPNRIELGLVQAPEILAQSGTMLMAKYANGTTFSSRQISTEEIRPTDNGSELSLPDFVRLVFLDRSPDATVQDRAEARAFRQALQLGCGSATIYRRFGGVEVFGYSQTRQGGERYHAYYVLDGGVVHYLDISGPDGFARQVLSTLHKRN